MAEFFPNTTNYEERKKFVQDVLFKIPTFDSYAKNYLQSAIARDDAEAFNRMYNSQRKNYAGVLENSENLISNELTALANRTDFSKLTKEQAEKELKAGAKENLQRVEAIENQIKQLKVLGIDTSDYERSASSMRERIGQPAEKLAGTQFTPAGTVRTESGFIPESEATAMSQKMSQNNALPPELQITRNEAGQYVFQGQAYDNPADAIGAQELARGLTPTYQDGTPYIPKGYRSSVLDEAGIDYSNFSEDQIKEAEQVYLAAGDSSLVEQAIKSPDIFDATKITDEDMQGFLDEAKEFITGEGSAFAQTLTRAKENFENELKFQAEEREKALELERIQKEEQLRSTKGGLEASGMTFSGEGVRQLGAESAFDKELLGQELPEGLIPTQQRLVASSAKARFEKSMRDYGRQMEEYLGATNLFGTQIPTVGSSPLFEVTPGIRGSLERDAEVATKLKAGELQEQRRIANQEILAGEGGVSIM